MSNYRKQVEVRWADVDANQHMRHSAYADHCTHVRMEWLTSNGFGFEQFAAQGFAPVLLRESTVYFKEVNLNERLQISILLAASNADGSKWRIRQEIFRADGKLAAQQEVSGAWMDLTTRKLRPPPEALNALFEMIGKTADFETIAG